MPFERIQYKHDVINLIPSLYLREVSKFTSAEQRKCAFLRSFYLLKDGAKIAIFFE